MCLRPHKMVDGPKMPPGPWLAHPALFEAAPLLVFIAQIPHPSGFFGFTAEMETAQFEEMGGGGERSGDGEKK